MFDNSFDGKILLYETQYTITKLFMRLKGRNFGHRKFQKRGLKITLEWRVHSEGKHFDWVLGFRPSWPSVVAKTDPTDQIRKECMFHANVQYKKYMTKYGHA